MGLKSVSMQGLVMWPYYAYTDNAVLNSMLCENVFLEHCGPRAFTIEACALILTLLRCFLGISPPKQFYTKCSCSFFDRQQLFGWLIYMFFDVHLGKCCLLYLLIFLLSSIPLIPWFHLGRSAYHLFGFR